MHKQLMLLFLLCPCSSQYAWRGSDMTVGDGVLDSGKASDLSVCSWPVEPIQWTPFPLLQQLAMHRSPTVSVLLCAVCICNKDRDLVTWCYCVLSSSESRSGCQDHAPTVKAWSWWTWAKAGQHETANLWWHWYALLLIKLKIEVHKSLSMLQTRWLILVPSNTVSWHDDIYKQWRYFVVKG